MINTCHSETGVRNVKVYVDHIFTSTHAVTIETMSTVTEQARKAANLRLLQRTCSTEICDIVQTATHVVLYEFSDGAWQKLNMEGSLFLVETLSSYMLIVLNRNSSENFTMLINASIQLQHQDPYVIVREQATSIRGFWFHNADERIAMLQAIQLVIQRLKDGHVPSPVSIPEAVPATAPTLASQSNSRSSSTEHVDAADVAASMMAPMAAMSTSAESSLPGVALDKKSLQLALLALIQDDRFLDLLHSQYLRVVHARAKKQNNSNSNTGK